MLSHELENLNETEMSTSIERKRSGKPRKSVVMLETEVSKQSVIQRIDDFVDAVTEMDSTILVPSRLMDMKVDDSIVSSKKTIANAALRDTDLYKLYSLVNSVKNQLQWGAKDSPLTLTSPANKSHTRRPSTASVTSSNSAGSTYSDTDSETGNEIDSGIEGDNDQSKPSFVDQIETDFQRHLSGLHSTLKQMTLAANYITSRYQREIGDGSSC